MHCRTGNSNGLHDFKSARRRNRVSEAERNWAGRQFGEGPDVGLGLYHSRNDQGGMLVQTFPGSSQSYSARKPIEQLYAELSLYLRHVMTERRLGNVENFGRSGQCASVCNGHKVPELPKAECHVRYPETSRNQIRNISTL